MIKYIRKIFSYMKVLDVHYKEKNFFKDCGEWIHQDAINDCNMIITSVAFNNRCVIEYQFKLINKYFRNRNEMKVGYLVVDNSSDMLQSDEIKKYCDKKEIAYVRLKNNPREGSASHALALNWICKNIENLDSNLKVLAFLDHDCFPINENNEKIWNAIEKQGFYGLKQERGDHWYLWPGFSFFDVDAFDVKQFDFMPSVKGDTGAEVGTIISESLKSVGKSDMFIEFPSQQYVEVMDKTISEYTQDTCVEVFDDSFVHLMNGSNWLGTDVYTEKSILIDDYLRRFIE